MNVSDFTPSWPPADSPRRRLELAAVELSAGGDFSNLTVPSICARAGMTADGFAAEFPTAEDCLLAAVDRAVGVLASQLADSASQGDPAIVVRQVLNFSAAEPALTELAVCHIASLGSAGQARRDEIVATLSGAVDQAIRVRQGGDPPRLLGTMVAGAVIQILGHDPHATQNPEAILEGLALFWQREAD